MRKKFGMFWTGTMEPSHSRDGATRHPVPLGMVHETLARPITLGDSRRQITRHPGWHLIRGSCLPIPADKPRGSRSASKTKLPLLTLLVEYYDPNRSAQPTAASRDGLATFRAMTAPPSDLPAALADAVSQYEASGNIGALMEQLHRLREGVTPDAIVAAAEAWLHMPEVAGPLYEAVVDEQPTNARALVILANAYWLSGRGPEVVGDLANRALAADPDNRGAWHLWALTESNARDRTIRWLQITQRFPTDPLAKAALADNAASLAASEHDTEALAMAITAYEELWALSPTEQQRAALETALTTLRNYKI